MSLEKINIKRFEGKKLKSEKFYFGISVLNHNFYYLITKPKYKKTTVKRWDNNFYSCFKIKNNYILLSTPSISIFDLNFKNRKDIIIDFELSFNLNKLNHKYEYIFNPELEEEKYIKKMKKLENILIKFL